MSDSNQKKVGSITWFDLTVPDAGKTSDFYSSVIGWQKEPQSMGEYDDFNMNIPENGNCAAGICHARGGNANLPAQWLIYITVKNLDESIAKCNKLGGEVINGPRNMAGHGRYCVIKDPVGAVAALFEYE